MPMVVPSRPLLACTGRRCGEVSGRRTGPFLRTLADETRVSQDNTVQRPLAPRCQFTEKLSRISLVKISAEDQRTWMASVKAEASKVPA